MKNSIAKTKLGGINSHIFPITLFSIFFTAILILVSAGSTIYVALVDGQVNNNETRSSLSYLSARLKSADAQASVKLSKGPEGDSVVMSEYDEDGNVYETRIYLYNGYLCEEYSFADTPVSPESAARIAKTDSFTITLIRDNLLEFSTQHGETRVALRNTDGVKA